MKKLLPFILLTVLTVSMAGQTTLYVSGTGNGSMDGSNWENALPGNQLQAAINQLESETQQNSVFVSEGVYSPTMTLFGNTSTDSARYFTFSMKKGVALYGGFSAAGESNPESRIMADTDENGTISEWEFTHPAILSGELQTDGDSTNNSIHIVSFVGCDSLTSILDGFTVQDGYNEQAEIRSYTTIPQVYASGIYSEAGKINNCYINRCYTINTNSYLPDNNENQVHIYGSGIFALNTILNACKIENCNAHANRNFGAVVGGGVFIKNCIAEKLQVQTCSITTVNAYYSLGKLSTYGAGVYAFLSYLNDCHISQCSNTNSHYGGYDYPYGGAAYLRACRVTNSSFINNSLTASHDVANGGGIFIGIHSSDIFPAAGMYNCIIANNTNTGKTMARGGGVFMMAYSTGWLPFPFVNNTVCNNKLMATSGTDLYGSGMDCSSGYWHEQVPVTLQNCIFWGNRKPASDPNDQLNVMNTSNILNNAIEGYAGSETSNINLIASNDNTSSGNVPYFRNPASFSGSSTETVKVEELPTVNWWIEEESACRDKGISDTTGMNIPAKAFYSNYRIFGETIDIGAAEYAKYTIHASADAGGMITPDGDSLVCIFDVVEFTIDHLESHSFVDLSLTGEAVLTEKEGSYFLSRATSDCNLSLETAILTFTLTSTAGEHGTVSPSSIIVNYGADQTFTIDPQDDYEIDAASFMGSDIKSEITQNGDVFEYTASSVISDGHLDVSFKLKVGTQESLTEGIRIYPNPAKDIVYLDGINSAADLYILDISGRILKHENTGSSLDISDLEQGNYILMIQLPDREIMLRLIKE